MKVPEFWLISDYQFIEPGTSGQGQLLLIPQHSFVKPIWNLAFVSKETRSTWIIDKDDVFCFTKFGLVPIPRKYIAEINDTGF